MNVKMKKWMFLLMVIVMIGSVQAAELILTTGHRILTAMVLLARLSVLQAGRGSCIPVRTALPAVTTKTLQR
jgi:hypothetical protein